MKAIIFSSTKNVLQTESEIQIMKFGYLFSNAISIAGQLAASLLFEKEHLTYSIIKKLQFMRDISIHMTDDAENKERNLKILNEFIGHVKTYKTLKHLNTAQSTIYNNSIITYSNWVTIYFKEIQTYQKNNGMLEMSTLSSEKKIELELKKISLGEYTYAKHEPEMNAKKILELLFSNNKSTEPIVLLLPYEFTIIKKTDNPFEVVDDGNKADIFEENEYENRIYHVLTMPDIFSLSVLQLKALNNELSEPFKVLNSKIDEWAKFCKTTDDLTILDKYFTKNMFEHFKIIQGVIDNNQTLKDIRNYPDFTFSENHIYFGIYPIEGLWSLYDKAEIVDTETVYYLRKRTRKNKLYPKFIPIINIVSSPIKSYDESDTNKVEENDHMVENRTRKFLSIED